MICRQWPEAITVLISVLGSLDHDMGYWWMRETMLAVAKMGHIDLSPEHW